MCSEIFTYFLEERGHWSSLSLKVDLCDLFSKTVFVKAESNLEKMIF